MPLHTILFFGGSILHEREQNDTERLIRNSRLNRFFEQHPPSESGESNLTEGDQRLLQSLQEAEVELFGAYSNLLVNFDAHQYLRCIHEHLAEFMVATENCTYLLHWGKSVLSQGRKEFLAHTPGNIAHIRRRDDDPTVERKVGRGRPVGAFARSASVVSPAKYAEAPLNMPQKVWFTKDLRTSTFDCVPTKRGPKPPEVVLEDTNKSSVVMVEDMNNFIGDMMKANLGFPAFSVSDCNSFHTSGYMWALYALRMARETSNDRDADAPVLFLNFDQHNDTGKVVPYVASDRWGLPACSQIQNGMYMSFGCGALPPGARPREAKKGLNQSYTWTNVFHSVKDGRVSIEKLKSEDAAGISARGGSFLTLSAQEAFQYIGGILSSMSGRWDPVPGNAKLAALNGLRYAGNAEIKQMPNFAHDLGNLDLRRIFCEFWHYFKEYLGKEIKYVYVTVDRDSIQGHQTQWGDDSLFPNAHSLYHTISSVVDPVFEVCPDARLIGFDITGLPESRVVYDVHTDHVDSVEQAWEEVMDELTIMYQWSQQRIAPCPQALQKAWSIFNGLHQYAQIGLLSCLSLETRGWISLFRTKLGSFLDGTSSETAKAIFALRNREMMQTVSRGLNAAIERGETGKMMSPEILKGYARDLAQLVELTGVYVRA